LEWGLDGMGPGIMQGPVCWHRGFPYVDGCMCVAMQADWQRLGGLDAEYYSHPGYWSDVDLSYRALRAGLKVRPCRSGIHHIVNYSGGNLPPYLEANQDNMIRFINRYVGPLMEQRPIIMQDVPRDAPDDKSPMQAMRQ
jgi:GT2 family glycosyltransferase